MDQKGEPLLNAEEIARLRPDLGLGDIRSLSIVAAAYELTPGQLLDEVIGGAPEGVVGDSIAREIEGDE